MSFCLPVCVCVSEAVSIGEARAPIIGALGEARETMHPS